MKLLVTKFLKENQDLPMGPSTISITGYVSNIHFPSLFEIVKRKKFVDLSKSKDGISSTSFEIK